MSSIFSRASPAPSRVFAPVFPQPEQRRTAGEGAPGKGHSQHVCPSLGAIKEAIGRFLRFLDGAQTEIQSRLCRIPGDRKKT